MKTFKDKTNIKYLEKDLISICIPTWNGARFIAATLESLISQDYREIEIIILDNQSTDGTGVICAAYAKRDSRIKYILDDVMVGDPEGHVKVASFAHGEYFLIACDDDIYESSYLRRLISILRENPEIGMAYTGLAYIDEEGNKIRSGLKNKYYLTPTNSKFYNFIFYLLHRNPIPTQFGLIRTNIHRKALEYFFRPDHFGGDHDNLYMLRLLSLTKVTSIPDPLFFYRIKDRSNGSIVAPKTGYKKYLADFEHQRNVSYVILEIIKNSDFPAYKKLALKISNYIILLYYVIGRH
jgi:glycosyltransferase involved in cell wall biosynthesis